MLPCDHSLWHCARRKVDRQAFALGTDGETFPRAELERAVMSYCPIQQLAPVLDYGADFGLLLALQRIPSLLGGLTLSPLAAGLVALDAPAIEPYY